MRRGTGKVRKKKLNNKHERKDLIMLDSINLCSTMHWTESYTVVFAHEFRTQFSFRIPYKWCALLWVYGLVVANLTLSPFFGNAAIDNNFRTSYRGKEETAASARTLNECKYFHCAKVGFWPLGFIVIFALHH